MEQQFGMVLALVADITCTSSCERVRPLRGRPTWDDRFSQYGIKVSFWGSGTLKTGIYVKN